MQTVTIDAVQWNADGDHPDVKLAGPTLHRRGQAAYISGMWPFATAWVEYERLSEKPADATGEMFSPMGAKFTDQKTGETYFRRVWLFSMWKMRGEKSEAPINVDDDFYLDCMAVETSMWHREEPYAPVPHGWLSPPAADGRVAVFPGNWIVTVGGRRLILSDDDYRKQYPA